MKTKLLFPIITIIILLIVALSGCQSTGVPQSQYDQQNAKLQETQAQLAEAQQNLANLRSQNDSIGSALQEAQNQIAKLQAQLGESSFAGASPAETAAKIVKYYHETHIYSTYDLFICSDMSAEIWNMLKAQGIKAVVAVGDIHTPITDIILSTHAWVLAEVAPGQSLALETTGGFAVPASQNALYYRGWTFDSPAALKSHNDLIKEYNVRVAFRNEINHAVNEAAELHNSSASQAEADKYQAVYDRLVELRTAQEATLNALLARINGLARPLNS
jgi:hypothetical protein